MRVCFIGMLVACLVIAVPTYFSGCDPDLQPACRRYTILRDATVSGYSVQHDQCWGSCFDVSRCIPVLVDCYTSYADFVQQDDDDVSRANSTCSLRVDLHNHRRDDALADAQDAYPQGVTYTVLKTKHSDVCYPMHYGRGLAITGIVFFVLAGVVLLAWLQYECGSSTCCCCC
jgi:hypothetical protein